MKVCVVLAGVAVLALAACASTPTQPLAPAPPVKVIVTAAPSLHNVIDVDRVTNDIELALRHLAPGAAPATVTAHFVAPMVITGPMISGASVHGNPEDVTNEQTVASFGPTPWLNGFQPVIGSYTRSADTRDFSSELAARGTYAITDANGKTLEEGSVIANAGKDQRFLAAVIARRVAQLAR